MKLETRIYFPAEVLLLLEQRASIPGRPDVHEPNVHGPNPMAMTRRLRFELILRIDVRPVSHGQFYRTGRRVQLQECGIPLRVNAT